MKEEGDELIDLFVIKNEYLDVKMEACDELIQNLDKNAGKQEETC